MSHSINHSIAHILQDPACNGIYRLQAASEQVPSLDGSSLGGKEDLLLALGWALGFPDYYAPNWDALEECLLDMSWQTGPIALHLVHADTLASDLLRTLMDIFLEAGRSWAGQGRCCSLFLSGLQASDTLPLAV